MSSPYSCLDVQQRGMWTVKYENFVSCSSGNGSDLLPEDKLSPEVCSSSKGRYSVVVRMVYSLPIYM